MRRKFAIKKLREWLSKRGTGMEDRERERNTSSLRGRSAMQDGKPKDRPALSSRKAKKRGERTRQHLKKERKIKVNKEGSKKGGASLEYGGKDLF